MVYLIFLCMLEVAVKPVETCYTHLCLRVTEMPDSKSCHKMADEPIDKCSDVDWKSRPPYLCLTYCFCWRDTGKSCNKTRH